MKINELVPNMQVVNPQAYNQLLKKQLTKTMQITQMRIIIQKQKHKQMNQTLPNQPLTQ